MGATLHVLLCLVYFLVQFVVCTHFPSLLFTNILTCVSIEEADTSLQGAEVAG